MQRCCEDFDCLRLTNGNESKKHLFGRVLFQDLVHFGSMTLLHTKYHQGERIGTICKFTSGFE